MCATAQRITCLESMITEHQPPGFTVRWTGLTCNTILICASTTATSLRLVLLRKVQIPRDLLKDGGKEKVVHRILLRFQVGPLYEVYDRS
jgi:hypothetical protein